MRRLLAFGLSHLIIAAGYGQIISAEQSAVKVSVEIRATSAERAVQELAKKTRLPLSVAPAIKDLVLVIKADDMTTAEVLSRVEEAVRGEWAWEKGVLWLRRDQQFTRRQRDDQWKDDDAYVRRIMAGRRRTTPFDDKAAETLALRISELLRNPEALNAGDSPETAALRSALSRTPSSRALDRIIETLDPAVLARLAPGQRIVFSSQPTAMQSPLSPRAVAIFAEYGSEQRRWREAATELRDAPIFERAGGVVIELRASLEADASPPEKVLVTVGRSDHQVPFYFVTVRAYNTVGTQILTWATPLSGDAPDAPNSWPRVTGREPQVVLPGDSYAHLKAILTHYMPTAGPRGKLSPALLERVLQPETYDPLNFAATDILFQIARVENRALFAQIDDSLLVPFEARSGQISLGAARRHLDAFDISRPGQALLIRPKRPLASASCPRPLLGKALRSANQQGALTLEQRAAFAFGRGKGQSVADSLLAMVTSSELPTMEEEGLRLLGSLSSDQRQAALNGGIALRLLSPGTLLMIRQAVYGHPGHLEANPSSLLRPSGLGMEPTEAFPLGLPPDALLVAAEVPTGARTPADLRMEVRLSAAHWVRFRVGSAPDRR